MHPPVSLLRLPLARARHQTSKLPIMKRCLEAFCPPVSYIPSTILGNVSFMQQQGFHSSKIMCRKAKTELSSTPTRFTTSPANTQSLPDIPQINEYQPIIVALSMTVFVLYFFLFREENDIDEKLNVGLFERVPGLEEPHLAQAIPRMKARGEDTTEAEARLKELIALRKGQERDITRN